ncbi:MAG: hypothetical protein GY710_18160 [Desulfobacteraceae bacterium]|nr:hypothetical protein [Desulfobacteraceae bacterium]
MLLQLLPVSWHFYHHVQGCQNHREYNQALNLYNRILKKNPKAKVFVHAGYGHISKKGNDFLTPMGKSFQEISGIAPFTIDQESMREHSAPEFENKLYKNTLNKVHPINAYFFL